MTGSEPDTPPEPLPGRPKIDRARIASRAIRIGILAIVVTVGLGVAAFAATSTYAQYGAVRNIPNAATWRGLTPRFAGPAVCATCHASEAHAQDASIHVDVACEVCHGPLAAHSASDAAARGSPAGKPPSEICATCHAAVAGRPATFPQIDQAAHYSGGECLRCHDPHSIVAIRPPVVSHPLAHLPECTTCHAPDGLKKISSGHELVRDEVCLSCHGRDAGRDRPG